MSTKMTPQLRFPEFTDDWQVKKLGDIVEFKNGKPFEDYVSESGEYNLITIDSVDIKGTLKSKFKKVTKNDSSLNKDDIVTVLSDIAHGNLLGLTALIPEDKRYVLNQRMGRLRPKGNDRADFLSQAINLKQVFFRKRGQGTSQRHIYERDIAQLELSIPSKPEQEKIADFLTAVDERIAVGKKKLELLETYKRGVMQKIFSQQVRFKDDNDNPYPDWEEKKLESLLVKNKKRNKNLEINYVQSVSNARGFVSQNDYFDGANIASKNTSNYFIIEKSTFAYNPSRINVGSLAYKSDETTSIVSPLYVSFKTQTGLLDGFLLPWFSTELFKKQMNRSFEGSVRDTLSFEALSDMRLMLPNEQEQQKIANFLTTLDARITAEKSKLNATRQFKKALLQRMFA